LKYLTFALALMMAESSASISLATKAWSGTLSSNARVTDDSVSIGGATIEVSFQEADFGLPRTAMVRWIRESACAVTEYYGRFPVRHLRIEVRRVLSGLGVIFGRTVISAGVPTITVQLGRSTSDSNLRDDWIMTHEMVHLAFPSVGDEHHWIEEGIATYVEPVARAQIGDLPAEKVWRDLVDGIKKGLPELGDRGLDNTHTWGRTYWGGALFCLMADVEVNRRTNNAHGLQDALRAIVSAGGNMEKDWPLTRTLKIGDDATGVPVLVELYDQMKAKPVTPDLAALWHALGVQAAGDSVVFDRTAPYASILHSIMASRSAREEGCRQMPREAHRRAQI
jgi:hypothetical protein